MIGEEIRLFDDSIIRLFMDSESNKWSKDINCVENRY